MKIEQVTIEYTVDLEDSGKVFFRYNGLPIETLPEPERIILQDLLKMFDMPKGK